MRFVWFAALMLCVCALGRGNTYYVAAVGGSDSNAGTSPSSPWKTIAKVNSSSFNPGDQILFQQGSTWRETLISPSSGMAGNPIIFGAYGSGNAPMISGANLVTGWSQYSGSIWAATVTTQPNVVIFNGAWGSSRSSTSSLQNPRDWYWSGSTLYVFSTSNPGSLYTNPGVEAGARGRCLSLTKSYVRYQNLSVSGCNGYAIENDTWGPLYGEELRNLTVQNTGNTGIQLPAVLQSVIDSNVVSFTGANGIYVVSNSLGLSSGITISNNIAHDIPGMAIGTDGDATHLTTLATITGNVAYNSGDGVYIHYTDNSTVSNNTTYSNTLREGIGIGISGCQSNIIQNNITYLNKSNGIELSAGRYAERRGAANNIVRYNVVHNNQQYGIKSSSSLSINNQVSYNIVFGQTNYDTSAIYMWSTGHSITNNTIYNNYNGITLYLDSANVMIKNNIIDKVQNVMIAASTVVPGFTCDYNLYYPSSNEFGWGGSYYLFSDWKSMTGQDAHSIMADPKFVSSSPSSLNDFKLLPSSPAIDAGSDLGSSFWTGLDEQSSAFPLNTIRQYSFGSGWEIGAFIFRQQFIVVVR